MRRLIPGILITVLAVHAAENSSKAFPGKFIYTDTPEIGAKWHGGVRMVDILAWDFNLNIHGWMSADLLAVGLKDIEGENGEKITDHFSLLTLKSLPYRRQTAWGDYALAGGLKLFWSEFKFQVAGDTNRIQSKNRSGGFFVTQSLTRGNHAVNVLANLSQRKVRLSTGEDERGTFYLAPGYAFSISRNWRVAAEHYWTNTEWLPIKALQYAFDRDKSEFHNPDQDIYSFMIWGFQYRRKHLRVDLNLAHHISFAKPIFPVVGVGWYF